MKLYHGTNIQFNEVNLKRCRPNKDFGQGFYLTDLKQQALLMAQRRCDIEGTGTPFVLEYEFDEKYLSDGSLSVKVFTNVCEEWAEFILTNRQRRKKNPQHSYDIVIGPIADDGVVFQLNRYQQKMIDLPTLVKELTFKKLNNQYYFGTPKSLTYLKRI